MNRAYFSGNGSLGIGAIILLSGACFGAATNPTLPQITPDPTRPAITGATIAVHSGDDLQAKYNAASCGDALVLDEGATFTGSYRFDKSCNSGAWFQIVSSGLASIPNTDYVACQINNASQCPEPVTTHYATIRSTTTDNPPFFTASDNSHEASYHYFGGLEVTTTTHQFLLVGIGNNAMETSANQFGTHLTFDKFYAHGLVSADSSHEVVHGIIGIANYVAIVNSYVTNIYSLFDTQAVNMMVGSGWLLHNNFLAAGAETIISGGAGAPPGFTCSIAASPAPTTTSATVNTCVGMENGAGGGSTPAVGTLAMFVPVSGQYTFAYYARITGNTAGALTFVRADNGNPLPNPPNSGALKLRGGLVPTDLTITHNVMYKPALWRPVTPGDTLDSDGIRRCTKNLGEIKIGYRWLIEGNWMENSYDSGCGGQPGVGYSFKDVDQNGDCPWCHALDITFQNNVLKTIGLAFAIGPCGSAGSVGGNACMQRLKIYNNLFWNGSTTGQSGQGIVIFASSFNDTTAFPNAIMDSVQVIHNNLLGPGNFMNTGTGYVRNYSNMNWINNIQELDQFRIPTAASVCTPPNVDGLLCLTQQVTGGLVTWINSNNGTINRGNGVIGGTIDDATMHTRYDPSILGTIIDNVAGIPNYSGVGFVNYPAVNTDYKNWALSPMATWHNQGNDGTDPGVNIAILAAALAGGAPPAITSTSITGQVTISGKATIQ